MRKNNEQRETEDVNIQKGNKGSGITWGTPLTQMSVTPSYGEANLNTLRDCQNKTGKT